MSEEKTTEQVRKAPNPTGKGGFGDHPEHRSNGTWDKNNSLGYWLGFFKSISIPEFISYEKENDMTVACELAYHRISEARKGELKEFQEIANRTEGKPKESVEHTGKIENILSQSQVDELLNRRSKENNSSGEV